VLLCIAIVFLASVALWRLSRSTTVQVFGVLVPRVATDRKVVALTFDDGPMPGRTEEVLEILGRYGASATFFLTGRELEEHPEQGRRIARAGHQIGNHSYSHTRMVFCSPTFVRDELSRTDTAIRATGFMDTILFRPPYGKKLFVLPYVLATTGRHSITWDIEVDSDAGVASDAQRMAAAILTKVRPGSIILMHVMYNSGATARAALPLVLAGLQQAGYRCVTVTELRRAAGRSG